MIGAIILQIILIFLNAVFASAEIAVISVNETKLKKMASDGSKAAKRLVTLKGQPSKFLSMIQVTITLAGFLGSAFAADSFAGPLVSLLINAGVPASESTLNSIMVLLITIVISYFSIVFGELVPKRLAMKNPDSLALKMSGMLFFVSKVFAPLVWLLTVSTNGVLRLMRVNPEQEEDPVTEEEIRMLLIEGNKKGIIPHEENEIIQNVFELDDVTVGQICTHRRNVVSLSVGGSMEEWERIIYENRHTYYPICGEESEDIIGVLDTKEYLRMKDKSRSNVIENAVDSVVLIPEAMKANVLLRKMKQSRKYFAVIIDEYGCLSGIITLHDLVEALVGDLDELDDPIKPKDIEKIDQSTWKIQGSAEIGEVSEALKIKLIEDDCDTFSGYICKIIGRIPDDGETFQCEADNLQIEVQSVENHIISESIVKVR